MCDSHHWSWQHLGSSHWLPRLVKKNRHHIFYIFKWQARGTVAFLLQSIYTHVDFYTSSSYSLAMSATHSVCNGRIIYKEYVYINNCGNSKIQLTRYNVIHYYMYHSKNIDGTTPKSVFGHNNARCLTKVAPVHLPTALVKKSVRSS